MENNGVITIPVAQRLDSACADEFKAQTRGAAQQARALVIDFSKTTFVDSVGLGALVSLLKICTQHGVTLSLAALSPQVRMIFELTRLYRLFDIFDTLEQAQASLLKQR